MATSEPVPSTYVEPISLFHATSQADVVPQVYSSTFTSAPSYDDLLGALSIIIWALTFMVTIKYVLVILHADNEGEGGTFSTYALLSRYVSISNYHRMSRILTGSL
jgi:KUP system potassium uptake protein